DLHVRSCHSGVGRCDRPCWYAATPISRAGGANTRLDRLSI
ncbi:MAG: hypothetical protein AVDCRST_MAG93-9988, partial [uncultured Chloroflexia bacterium]